MLVLLVLGALAAALYLYFTSKYRFWQRRGVPYVEPTFFFGNVKDLMLGRQSFPESILELATRFRERGYCGLYQWAMPILLVFEPEMVKQILTKDFTSFHDRGMPHDIEGDPLSANLFNLAGPKWRNLRNRMTPAFTSGKLKLMLPLMLEVAEELSALVAEQDAAAEVNLSHLLSLFSTDLIGTCAFGLKCSCLRDGHNEFLTMSRGASRLTAAQIVRNLLSTIHPSLVKLIPVKLMMPGTAAFFTKLMEDTVRFREEQAVERNDFVQLMMQLRQADLAHLDPRNHIELTPSIMAAQAHIFFVAGLDNTAFTVAYTLSRLAADPDLQRRAAREVQDVLRDHGGQVSYEALKAMDLLDRVVREGLRLWSPVGILFRKCNATTRVGDLLVEKGMSVFVVADAMHRNPDLFPDPERFDPERHSAEQRARRHPYAYLPFGEGPRVCIAERFALLEMKLAMAVLLRDFEFTTGPSFEPRPEMDPRGVLPKPKRDFKLFVTKRRA